MKSLIIIILIAFLLPVQLCYSQVGDIKNASSNSNGGFLSDAAREMNAPFALCCSDLFIDLFFDVVIFGGWQLHKHHIDSQDEIQRVKSIEFMPQFAFHAPSTYQMLPRIRGNYGLFSTDFRYSFMVETNLANEADIYKTIDWQILVLNLVVTDAANFRIGYGFMYEDFSDSFFNESTVALDVYLNDDAFIFGSEFRFAMDYESDFVPRTEGSLNLNFRILVFDRISVYANLACLYQDYYNKVDLLSVKSGLNFKIQ